MTQTYENLLQNVLTEKDLQYLHHIGQVLIENNQKEFDLEELDPAWLTTDKLHSSTHYWKKYSWTRVIGWLIGLPAFSVLSIATVAFIWFFFGIWLLSGTSEGWTQEHIQVGIALVIIAGMSVAFITAIVVVSALGIGHALAAIFNLGADTKFGTGSITNQDRKFIRWSLEWD